MTILLAGVLISFIYSLKIIIMAFSASLLWGLGCIFIPFCMLIFIICYWNDTKKVFFKTLISIPVIFIGMEVMTNPSWLNLTGN